MVDFVDQGKPIVEGHHGGFHLIVGIVVSVSPVNFRLTLLLALRRHQLLDLLPNFWSLRWHQLLPLVWHGIKTSVVFGG